MAVAISYIAIYIIRSAKAVIASIDISGRVAPSDIYVAT